MKNDIYFQLKELGVPSEVLINIDYDEYGSNSTTGSERMFRYGFRSLHDRFEMDEYPEAA